MDTNRRARQRATDVPTVRIPHVTQAELAAEYEREFARQRGAAQ